MSAKRQKRPAKRKKELLDLMKFVKFTNLFKSVERLIWFKGVDRRECDGEHTFQLAIVCWFVNERCKLGLDLQTIIEYALVHDLLETYAGDTPAFVDKGNGTETPCREDKLLREALAMKRITQEWGKLFPTLIKRLESYEAQKDAESNFVYAMDKLLATLNIALDEGRTNHRLGLSLETVDLYKRPRIARHQLVLELYEEHFKMLLANRDTLFPLLKLHHD